jgi:hypothetical protein
MDNGNLVKHLTQKAGQTLQKVGQKLEDIGQNLKNMSKQTKRPNDSDQVDITSEDGLNIKRPKNNTSRASSDDSQAVPTCISIALVLKAKEARGLEEGSYLDQETFKQLLDDASYFLCVSEHEMANKWQELQELQFNEDINSSSEQPVVARLDLPHRGPLKKFATKLELKRHLLESEADFKYCGCVALIKPILIKKLGFQRS